jgi:hypothetical protein
MDKENVYIYTMEHYSAIKKNEIMTSAGKCLKLEVIMFRKINQTHKDECCMFSLICGI